MPFILLSSVITFAGWMTAIGVCIGAKEDTKDTQVCEKHVDIECRYTAASDSQTRILCDYLLLPLLANMQNSHNQQKHSDLILIRQVEKSFERKCTDVTS